MAGNICKGGALVLCAAFCWGLISPLAKIISAAGIDLMTLMLFRSIFTIFASCICIFLLRDPARLCMDRERARFYFLCGVLSVVMSGGGFLKSLDYLTVPQAIVIHYTFPLVTLAGSMWVTREKPAMLQIAAGFIIVAGVITGMGGKVNSFTSVPAAGFLWALLAVIGISGQTLAARRFSLSHENDELAMLFYANIFASLLLIAYKTAFVGWADVAFVTPRIFMLMCIVGFTGSFLSYGLFYAALKYIPAAVASLFCTFEIVVAVGLTALLVGQVPSGHEILGCALILIAIFCASAAPKKKK
ncbi:MAG: DMT family transporter [Synergistes sp.]|nr:DMT family transporter [Synergistes sp.]